MEFIILGLGSNLGDSEENLRQAVSLINAGLLADIIQSQIHKSPPLLPAGAPENWKREFSNIVIAGTLKQPTKPLEFLRIIKTLEAKLGRTPAARWAPREIDIDILAWKNEIIDLPELQIPHKEMLKRDFVMSPLYEILPHWTPPK